MQEIPYILGLTAGELSPWLSSRFDLQAYLRGAARMSNVLTLPYGGVLRRRGTEYVHRAAAAGSTAVKLFPFRYSESDVLMLEFFSGGMRVYKDGELLKYNGEPYVLTTPWIAPSVVKGLRFTQINDVVYVTSVMHPPMMLVRDYDTHWYCREVKFAPYPRETYSPQNDVLHVEMEANDTYATLTLDAGSSATFLASMVGTEHLMADADIPTMTLFQGEAFDRQNLANFAEFYKYTVPVGTGGYVKNEASNMYRYYTCIREFNATHFNGSTDPDDYPNFFLPGFMWLNADGKPYEVCADWEIRTNGEWNATWELWRSYDTPEQGSDYGLWNWTRVKTFSQSDFSERQNWALTGSEPYPCRMVLVCRGSRALSIDPMLYFRSMGGTREYHFKIISVTNARKARAEVVGKYLSGNKSFSTRSWSFGAFGGLMYFPRFSAFYQGRLWFSGIPGMPTTLLGSCVDDFTNFRMGSNDDDALHLTLASDNQSEICWICAARELLLGTTGGEWVLSSSSGASLTATTVGFHRQSSVGSAALPAQAVENTVLFIQRGGKRLREISYKLESDGFTATDSSILAEHLLRAGVQEWCVQRGSNFYVWVLMQDGSVAVLTLNPEQNVTAWQRMEFTGRRVVQLATLPGASGNEDEVWLVLHNPVSNHLSLERIRETSAYLDGFKSVAVQSAGKLTGLEHLAGLQVKFAPSGSAAEAFRDGTVSADGSLSVAGAAVGTVYEVGRVYTSELQTMPMESQNSFNTVRQLSRVRLRLLESDLNFSYKSSGSERWESYSASIGRLSVPFTGSVRLTQMPSADVGQGFSLQYSGLRAFCVLAMTIEVDYHGR